MVVLFVRAFWHAYLWCVVVGRVSKVELAKVLHVDVGVVDFRAVIILAPADVAKRVDSVEQTVRIPLVISVTSHPRQCVVRVGG